MIQQHRQYLENICSVCGSYLYVIDELLEILNEWYLLSMLVELWCNANYCKFILPHNNENVGTCDIILSSIDLYT